MFHEFYTLFESQVLVMPSLDRLRVLTFKHLETRHLWTSNLTTGPTCGQASSHQEFNSLTSSILQHLTTLTRLLLLGSYVYITKCVAVTKSEIVDSFLLTGVVFLP